MLFVSKVYVVHGSGVLLVCRAYGWLGTPLDSRKGLNNRQMGNGIPDSRGYDISQGPLEACCFLIWLYSYEVESCAGRRGLEGVGPLRSTLLELLKDTFSRPF